MGLVRTGLTAITLEVLKQHLKIEPSDTEEDEYLEMLLDAVKASADTFLQRDFKNPDGSDKEIPPEIGVWVLQRCNRLWERRADGLAISTVFALGVTSWTDEEKDALRPWRRWPGM